MKLYPWAQNRAKLERAIGELGPDATEEALKARYVEMAGLVLSDEGYKEEIAVKAAELPSEDEKPKKAKKK